MKSNVADKIKMAKKIIGRIGKEREVNATKEEENNAMTEIQKRED
jgi:hypothetical protein